MAKLLYIESSPRKTRSASITVAKHFLEAYQKAHSGDTIEVVDLWRTELPPFNEATIDAKYAVLHGQTFTPEQAKAWEVVKKLADQFKGADRHLISLPMWNFGLPYILKHYIDLITQPGLTFSFSPEKGYSGLVTGKPVAVVYARGGAYGPGSGGEAYDQQVRYMHQFLGFVGFTKITDILVEPTLASGDAKDKAIASARQKAEEVARTF